MAVPDRSVNFRSAIVLYRAARHRRPTDVRKGIAEIFCAISKGPRCTFIPGPDREQIKQFPNPLLISLTDDFVTRTIVGVTEPIDARNCLGRGMLWDSLLQLFQPTDTGLGPMTKLIQAYDSPRESSAFETADPVHGDCCSVVESRQRYRAVC